MPPPPPPPPPPGPPPGRPPPPPPPTTPGGNSTVSAGSDSPRHGRQERAQRPVKEKPTVASLAGVVHGEDGALMERWDPNLPRPPSAVREIEGGNDGAIAHDIKCCVFNANTREGSTLVRMLSAKGFNVVAVVRIYTSSAAKQLIKLKRVTVKVADVNNSEELLKAAEGCQRAFVLTKYWEKFDSKMEEQMATTILETASKANMGQLVLVNFEDAKDLKARGRKSQIIPDENGIVFPKFHGMKRIFKKAESLGNVQIVNMLTSYFDGEVTDKDGQKYKRSLVMLRTAKGKLIVEPNYEKDDEEPRD